MKAIFPFLFLFVMLLSFKKKESNAEVSEVQIEEAALTEKQQLDYERVLQIDSIQNALQLQKDSLLSGLVCVADCGIVRTGGQTVPPYRDGSKQGYSNELRADTNQGHFGSIGIADKRASDGGFSPSDAGSFTKSESATVKQGSVLATFSRFHP